MSDCRMRMVAAKICGWSRLAAWLLLAACSQDAPTPADSVLPSPDTRPAGLVAPEAEWRVLASGYVYTDAPAVSASGELFFAAPMQDRIFRMPIAGEPAVFAADTQMAMGLNFAADGRLYACSNRGASIVAYSTAAQRTVVYQGELTPLPGNPDAAGEFCNDVAVRRDGGLWFTDRVNERVLFLGPEGDLQVVADGFRPNGIQLSLDEQLLVVTDSNAPRLWAFAVQTDGSLREQPGYFPAVRTVSRRGAEDVRGRPGSNGLTVDADGRFYLSSFYGIQVYDRDGRYLGAIDKPAGFVSNLTFAGADRRMLVATGVKSIWGLTMQVAGPAAPARAK